MKKVSRYPSFSFLLICKYKADRKIKRGLPFTISNHTTSIMISFIFLITLFFTNFFRVLCTIVPHVKLLLLHHSTIFLQEASSKMCVCVEQNFHRKDLQMMKIFRHKVQSQRQWDDIAIYLPAIGSRSLDKCVHFFC